MKIELLKLRLDLREITPHGQLEYIYRFMESNNLSLRIPGHIGQLLPKDTNNAVINYIIELWKLIKEGAYGEYNIINTDETPLYLNRYLTKLLFVKELEM